MTVYYRAYNTHDSCGGGLRTPCGLCGDCYDRLKRRHRFLFVFSKKPDFTEGTVFTGRTLLPDVANFVRQHYPGRRRCRRLEWGFAFESESDLVLFKLGFGEFEHDIIEYRAKERRPEGRQ